MYGKTGFYSRQFVIFTTSFLSHHRRFNSLCAHITLDAFTSVRAFYTSFTYLIGRKCWRGYDAFAVPSCQEKAWCYWFNQEEYTFTAEGPKQMLPHMLIYISSLFSFRALCSGGSPHHRTAKTERSSTTRSNTGKDREGVKPATPPPAPSFSSSSAVMETDSAVSSQLAARV